MSESPALPLGQQMLRGVNVFQAIIALPIFILLGSYAFFCVLAPESVLLFYFITDTVTAIMAAGIIFSVYVQRKAQISMSQYLSFEAAKSVLATGLWLWFVLDSAFGPWLKHCRNYGSMCDQWGPRTVRALLSGVVLLVFFYPPLVYVYMAWKKEIKYETEVDEETGGEPSERAPLLA